MSTFLSAEWSKLILINYAIEEKHLLPYLPTGTQLDTYNGICYVSLVGFMFVNTKLKGIPVPFHQDFEEVNLRFYVKHKTKNGAERRGVVFIKEIVPKMMITFVANTLYGEHYETLDMDHSWNERDGLLEVEYKIEKEQWYSMKVIADPASEEIPVSCEAEFITEHYWGYTKLNETETSEYEVWHPRWKVHPVKSYSCDFDFGKVYGSDFAFINDLKPFSVMLAEGSEIKVMEGGKLS
ncbi:MAG: hypothetical protein RL007_2457 [Bacteroidota bacterium]|jgi:uncharacterized protein YqjF (DUF2071 family)